MSILRHLRFLALFLLVQPALASSEAANGCSINSYKDILACALQRHPNSQVADLQLKQDDYLVGIAEQRPNPELDSQVLFGNAPGDVATQYTQVNLAHTFELGGKRSARIRKSEAMRLGSQINKQMTQDEVYTKTYLSLVRIRQIQEEISVFDDALNTFERIQKQYRSRPRMTPEQKATYSLMDIASRDYKLRRQALQTEELENEKVLELAVGQPVSISAAFLPARKKNWPKISASTDLSESLAVKKSLADIDVAQAELSEANGTAWPDLKLGPTFETASQGSQRADQFGVNLTFALPLYHLNGAGKAYARAGILKAETQLGAAKRIVNNELELNRRLYEDVVGILNSEYTIEDLKKKHKEIEVSFSNGVLPSSIIIELHRQLADYTKSINERETEAIEALAKIYSIQGRLIMEGL